MQCIEEIAGLLEGERFGLGACIQRFESRLPRISMAMGNAVKFCIAQFRRCHDCAVDD